jgi:hypothetical protein
LKSTAESVYSLVNICLKERYDLSQLPFNFALEYAFRKDKENEMGWKLNGTHYVNDVNLGSDNLSTMKEKTQEFHMAPVRRLI